MLSQIRHIQKGVLILVTVVIVIAFAFLYSDYDNRGGSPNTAFIVYGKAYRDKEAQVLYNSFDVAQRLMMYDFMRTLFGGMLKDNTANFIGMILCEIARFLISNQPHN